MHFKAGEVSLARRGLRPRGRRAHRLCLGLLAGLLILGPLRAHDVHGAGHELLAMPYACRVERGEVRMQRSGDRYYRVIGSRDQQSLRVCATRSTGQCRTLDIHRFTFDCDGVRIPWIEAAEATAPVKPWRQQVIGGRMTLRFWVGGPLRDRQPPVTLPAGFAPTPASGLRFVTAEAATVAMERELVAPPPPPQLVARSVASSSVTRLSGEAVRAKAVADAIADTLPSAEPAALRKLELVQPSPVGFGWTASAALANESAGSSRWTLLPPGGTSNTLLAVLGLAAVLLSATAVAARHRRVARGPVEIANHAIDEGAAINLSVVRSASAVPPPPTPPPPLPRAARQIEPDEPPMQLASAEAGPPPVPGQPQSDWDAVVEMGTTAAALLEIVQQIIVDHVPDGPLREVLDGELVVTAARLNGPELTLALDEGRLDLVHPVYAQAILDLERVRTLARIEHERLLEVGEGLPPAPATFDEACSFLGVNPRAGESVVKKVVDALRQNWHPDLADDDDDRSMREERIKRINAAWDLIRAR